MDDLQETFDTLRQYKMKLNLSKCAFGVSSEKFLRFMVSQKGIEANLDKIQAILNMEPPRNIKEVQSLTERVAALNRYVSKSTYLKYYLKRSVCPSSKFSGRHSNG